MLPKIKTILYATGLGPGAPFVFRYALALARQHQANIVAVHAMEPLTPFGQSLVEQYIPHDTSEEMHEKARETVKTQLRQKLEQLCASECNGATDCQNLVTAIRVVEGYPAQVILDIAGECSVDLIIMGAHHHTRVSEVILGSTTRKVLHTAEQPVFVVKIPKGQSEELE
jgi:nucleotide-binding universal stress UspA family protein